MTSPTEYRTATMSTLKVAFLSSLILELLATISVALVAVAIGLRLLGGHLSLASGLFVLILAPEAYLPLRLLGTNYHASAEGMKAAEDIFEVLEQPLPARGTLVSVPDPSRSDIRVEGLEVHYAGRRSAALSDVGLKVEPRGGAGDRRPQWLRKVDPTQRSARTRPGVDRFGPGRRLSSLPLGP